MRKNVCKVLSFILTLAIVFSAFACSSVPVLALNATYFVSASGLDTNDGISEATAVTSIQKAIELANLKYTTGDTVTVKVMGTEVSLGTLPTHNFDLIVEGIEDTQTIISSTSGRPVIVNNENGNAYFKNVEFQSSQTYAAFLLNNTKNVVFDSTVKGFGGNKYVALGSYTDDGAAKTFNGQNVEFNNSVGIVYLGNYSWQNKTYNEDVNISVIGGGSPNFYFNSGNYKSNYKKNLNINIEKANSIKFTNSGTVTVEGALQVINSSSNTLSVNNSAIANITGEKYFINNITGNSKIIEFTDTKGKFKVDTTASQYEVIAKDTAGNITKVDENGYLTLTASGDYELSLFRSAQSITYYASKNGSDDADGTKEAPLNTIGGAINKALANGMLKGDTVTVKLLGDETIEWHTSQNTPTHDFNLVVESNDRNNYSKVNIKHATYLGGPTEVKYGVYEIIDPNNYPQLRINNKDFTIGDGANFVCLYYTFGDNSTSNTIAGQNVVFKNDISSPNIYLSNILHSNKKRYSADVNVTVDNPFAEPTIRLSFQNGTVYYDANVNLIIKDAIRVTFSSQNKGTNVCNGAIQLISNSKTKVDPDGIEYLKTTCNPTKSFYHIINATDFKDLISVTEIAGKYAVDTEKYDVTASDSVNQIKAKDGFLTLSAGTYTVTATQIKEDTVPVITEKLDNTVINLWEVENNELNINNSQSVATVNFGEKIYEDVKINVLNAQKIIFSGEPQINGSLHIAVNNSTTVDGKEVVEAIKTNGGKWYVVNNSGEDITFGKEKGEIVYTANGVELEAVNNSIYVAPKFKSFLLNEGEYIIRKKEKSANLYDNYIDYRGSNLANTYAKIKNNQKLNVVYFGGSVTNGTGASSKNTTSWRALIGQWLENTYTNVKFSNINSAIGATGTMFGSYRLDKHVISRKPDLLFIEFSINDFYDFHYSDPDVYGRSAMQLETLIRNVRKQLPECDIVVLHTIEKMWIDKARNGEFYIEAQAHNDMAKAYDIPTINLGGALANAMPENWEAVWSEYVTDLVHPSDKGYEIYYNVIKEYLSNCLLYTEHNGNVTNHTVPEMLSDTLLDGDINYIDASRELLEKSAQLGGTNFEYKSGELYLNDEFGSIVSTANEESLFVIKFTGTELAMAINGSSNLGGFKVKIDDGEYKDVESINVLPRILATGLSSGEHIAYIKPVNSSSGNVLLNIIGFYTRDASKATHKHNFTNYIYNNDAKCGVDGTETAECDRCDATDTRTAVGTALEHKYENHVYNNDATCTKDGTKTATCSNGCGKKETITAVGTKLPHKNVTVLGSKATLTANGSLITKCSVCGTPAGIATPIAKIASVTTTAKITYNGKTKTPAVVVKDANGRVISSSNYTVSYAKGRKNYGKYKITVTFKGNYSGSKVIYFEIVPKNSKISKLTAAKKSLKVKLSRQKKATGYQIQYSTSKTFKSAKTVTLKKNSITSKTIKKLKAKKTYYVRVRTYKQYKGKKYYSAWSAAKKKKTK